MTPSTTYKLKSFGLGVLNSYSQVFFSDKWYVALVLLVVTFFDVWAGLSGIVGVILSNALAIWMGYDRQKIAKGLYGFNSLLISLGLGVYFAPGVYFYMLLLLAAIFTFFISLLLEGVIGKYALPYLSIPFLISIWLLTLASRDFEAIGISQRGIYTLNDLYSIGGQNLVDIYTWWNGLPIVTSLRTYFISLGAIFFQYNVLSGILISFILLVYSRIAFSLSLIGFYAAYLFYQLVGANITELSYSYIGFNYILTSIAIGGFFLVPSKQSYLWTIILIPLVAILTISLNSIFALYQLPVYSLPFNIIVLLFVYILKLRVSKSPGLAEVAIQQSSPEKNLYSHNNSMTRFNGLNYFPIRLPFWGEWRVSQGHDGSITHRGDWKHAWDFVIEDEDEKTFRSDGQSVADYYCYDKMILAPAGGYVEEILDGIEDNEIGQVNLLDNWGNCLIIRHSDFLFTKLCHIKSGSFTVVKGEYVRPGQPLALIGNSGRSPEPHLHFQMQSTPYIGSATLDYPLSYFVVKLIDGYSFETFSRPRQNEKVSSVKTNDLLRNAYTFIPGKKIRLTVDRQPEELIWEVLTTVYNEPYIYCRQSKSIAYFSNDGIVHYFKHFEGDKNSILYLFFLSSYKVQTGFYENLEIQDSLPSNLTFHRAILFLQDFIAPFGLFLKANYYVNYSEIDDDVNPELICLNSKTENLIFGRKKNNLSFEITIDSDGLKQIIVKKQLNTSTLAFIRDTQT